MRIYGHIKHNTYHNLYVELSKENGMKHIILKLYFNCILY